jgi:histone acetyltransferase (RNA polymerase elongator complex component)
MNKQMVFFDTFQLVAAVVVCCGVQVRNNQHKLEQIELVVREYAASGGREYFISYETPCRKTICGFCRLRISDSAGCVTACMCLSVHVLLVLNNQS